MNSSSNINIEKELQEIDKLTQENGLEIDPTKRAKDHLAWSFNLTIPQDMNNEVERIKIISFSNSDISKMLNFPYYYLAITKKNGLEKHYVLKEDTADSVLAFINQIAKKLPNNCVEIRQKKQSRLKTTAFPDYYWSNLGPWATESSNEASYANIIDPIMIETFKKIILEKYPQNIFTVIDAGGGKGRLAKKLIETANEMGVKLNYFLIEPDQSQCEEAKKIFSEIGSNAKIFCATLDKFHSSPDFENHKNAADFIISSGGPLNLQVVSRDDAVANIKILREMLNDDGCIIAAGKSKLALKKKEMEKHHFDVLQTHVMEEKSEDNNNLLNIRQVYVLKKKKDNIKDHTQDITRKNKL